MGVLLAGSLEPDGTGDVVCSGVFFITDVRLILPEVSSDEFDLHSSFSSCLACNA